MFASRGVGAYVASEVSNVFQRRLAKPQDDPAILLFFGYGSTGDTLIGSASLPTMIGSSYLPICCDWGGTATFGNDTARSRAASGVTYVQGASAPAQAKAGKVFLFGNSMGGFTALNYTRANPSTVAAVALLQGGVDLADAYNNNRGGYASAISTAYGGAPASSKNPAANPSDFAGIPIKLYYTSGDTTIIPATQTAFAAAVATCTATSIGSGAHGDTTGFSVADMVAFFDLYR